MTAISTKADSIDMLFYDKGKSEDFTEPVIWMQTIFPHKVNRGYFSGAYVVQSVNGIKVMNFNHFVSLIDELKSEFVVIETLNSLKIILNVKEAKDSFRDLQSIYGFNSDRRVE